MSNQASGYECPLCGSDGPHDIVDYIRNERHELVTLILACREDRVHWNEETE